MAEAMPTIVSFDEGSGPMLAIKDATGRLITAEQMQLGRQHQEAEFTQVAGLKDKLTAGDAATIELVLGQMRDELSRRLAMLDQQRSELSRTFEKLTAREEQTVRNVLSQMKQRLERRVTLMQGSLDRSDAILTQLQSAKLGAVPIVSKPVPQTIVAEPPMIQVGGVVE
jgi:hypothetical protein